MNRAIHIFPTPEDTARAVAELIVCEANEKHQKSQSFNMAVSGGNTPTLLFTILANEYFDKITWHTVRIFWVDERCVPSTHAESNVGMTYEILLKNLPIQEANIFRMVGETDSEKEAARYQQLLEKELPLKNNIPQFDLILLGMGDDGHTASIFPQDVSLLNSDKFVAVSTHPVSGQQRITLTGTIINAARRVVFLITGASKAPIIGQLINQVPDIEKYPAAHIHSADGLTEFYLDKDAAKDISDVYVSANLTKIK